MTISEMEIAVKNNLGIKDDTRDILISDVILLVCDYCNLDQESIPNILEPVIRKKAKDIIDYEALRYWDTVLRSPASRKVTEVSHGPRRTAIPRQAFIA